MLSIASRLGVHRASQSEQLPVAHLSLVLEQVVFLLDEIILLYLGGLFYHEIAGAKQCYKKYFI